MDARTKITKAQAAQQERSWGRGVSNCMDHIVEEQITPKVDWKEVLLRFVDQSVKDGEEMGHIVIAVNTSGSVSPRELDLFAAEINRRLHNGRQNEND